MNSTCAWRMKANDEEANFTHKEEEHCRYEILRSNQVCFSTLPLNLSCLKIFVTSKNIMSLTLFLSIYRLFIVVHNLLKKCTGVF